MHVRRGNDQMRGCQYRNALGSNSAAAAPPPYVCVSIRRGDAGSLMSNNENCHAGLASVAGVHPALPDPEQQVLADRVQVARVAGDLQLAHDLRRCSVAQVENIEGIGLTERHDVPALLDESRRSD